MFKSVKRITVWEGLESLKYTLYDEEKDRLISFEEYDATSGGAKRSALDDATSGGATPSSH